jgi:peptidoglycan-associated lipoprotein
MPVVTVMHRFVLVSVVIAFGCHHQAAVKAPLSATAEPPAKAPPPTVQQKPAGTNVAVSDDLAKRCNMTIDNVPSAPKFDFDHAELEPSDRDVLQQIATCVTTGPLAGRHLELVGRADPRGTEEYNLGLGTRRAGTVATYLERLGVRTAQLAETTRGALDAAGTNESGWRDDRRVDVKLE